VLFVERDSPCEQLNLDPLDSLKTVLPLRFKHLLRRMHRRHVLRSAVEECRKLFASGEQASDELLEQLIYGWGNAGWSADPGLLRALLSEKYSPHTRVLECGTGLSTLLFGLIAAPLRLTIVSLEHDETWYRLIRGRLKWLGLPDSGVRLAPLRSYADYDWYDIGSLRDSDSAFNLLLCDGPPSGTRGGRYGLLPSVLQRLTPGARIIVDDTTRLDEQTMISRWTREFPGRVTVENWGVTFAVLSVL
jgi:predicted O-methyltransferase YrrM